MALAPAELRNRIAIPIEPEPRQAVHDGADRVLGGTGAVGILDPEQEFAAVVAGKEPIEERGAGAADMQIAGWGWCKTRDNGHGRQVYSQDGAGAGAVQ